MNAQVTTVAADVLTHWIKAGIIRLVDGEYIGIAADGAKVSLGCATHRHALLAYLETHPSRYDW
jgi:hypothetical protein